MVGVVVGIVGMVVRCHGFGVAVVVVVMVVVAKGASHRRDPKSTIAGYIQRR